MRIAPSSEFANCLSHKHWCWGGVVPFESIKGMMHKILEDTYIKVWYIGDLDVKIKLCKIKI